MEKKTKNFIRYSFIGITLICIVVFFSLTIFLSRKTQNTILEISEIYVTEMSVQFQHKFSSIMELNLEKIDGIMNRTPSDNAVYGADMLDELRTSANTRNFAFLGFLAETGELETIYGEDVSVHDDHLIESLHNDGNVVTIGTSNNGETILLFGRNAYYPMADGKTSTALVAGIFTEQLNESLYLSSDNEMSYSHIISQDGTYVTKNPNTSGNNYFEHIREKFDLQHEQEAEPYITKLQEAINTHEDCSISIIDCPDPELIHSIPLVENSAWYLVTVMPEGVLNSSITELNTIRISIMIGSTLLILFVMTFVFIKYYKLSQNQLKALNVAKDASIRANTAKSEFLSSMSHDIRTPMNAIVGMTAIALKNLNDPVRVEDCLKKIKLSSKHLLGLINDVLDMSKIESGKMTLNIRPVSLRETMDDIVNIIRPQVKSRNQFFDIFIQKILVENVCCDGVRLNQVLLNLLSNALKFTPEQGRIDVHLYQEPSSLGENYVQTHFLVHDTGIGMSEEFRQRVFESFERENTEQVQHITGSGLGMAITKHIVDLMGGTIEVQSEPGKGTQFHVTLDLEKAMDEAMMKLPDWNILVVDDNEQLCLSAAFMLEELGAHADWTMDGRKAVQMIEERHNRNDDYRFVLVDWKMPNMDGLETIREIRNRVGKGIPVFLISAYDWSDIEEEIQAAEIEGFIPKPLFKSTLHSCLSQYTEEYQSEIGPSDNAVVDFTGKRMLLAEDIDINWEIAYEILSEVGLELERAENGLECVEKFKDSECGYYDGILMDIRMPIMNGYDATINIRKLDRPDKDLPIIAMTADAFSDDAQRCIECGMNSHLSKPLDIKECMRVLQEYLGK